MKTVIALALLFAIQACSNEDTSNTTSKATCDSWGGEIVNGSCEIRMTSEDLERCADDPIFLEPGQKGCMAK